MKRASSILLLFLFLIVFIGGQSVIFHFYRIKIRAEAKSITKKMADSEGEILKFSRQSLLKKLPFQVVKKHEIIFQGNFYDIKKIKIVNDSIIVIAFNDKNEKQLVTQFSKYLRQRDKKGEIGHILLQFSQWTFLLPHYDGFNYPMKRSPLDYKEQKTTITQISLSKLSPPPEVNKIS